MFPDLGADPGVGPKRAHTRVRPYKDFGYYSRNMKLIVNGETREVSSRTVLGLLEELHLQPQRMVVEHNGVIVQRDSFGDTRLSEGDVLELVRLVGGG